MFRAEHVLSTEWLIKALFIMTPVHVSTPELSKGLVTPITEGIKQSQEPSKGAALRVRTERQGQGWKL